MCMHCDRNGLLRLSRVVLLSLVVALTGCMSMAGHGSASDHQSALYAGTCFSMLWLTMATDASDPSVRNMARLASPLILLDLPATVVVDTALAPVNLVSDTLWSRDHESDRDALCDAFNG